MYKKFYNLKRNPFEITPDPSFLYTSRMHNEALATLYHGVRRRKGFVVLTGEVGTGKTLLVRCLLQILQRANVAFAYVFNPRLSPTEFLQYIAGDLGLVTTNKSKSELLLALSSYVIARHQKGLTTVLVVDEAHLVSADVLEEIRLLTNLETTQEKLLQILLIGQQELEEKLDSRELRQLKQRIALRSHLGPLDPSETRGYVDCRLRLAGNTSPAELFPQETIAELHRQTRGFPRLINTVCENALVLAYAAQSKCITPEIVREVAVEFRLNVLHSSLSTGAKGGEPSEVERAAKVLLDLYHSLKSVREPGVSFRIPVATGTRKDEPYI
jgi:general secretion pathway protein A